MTFVYTLQSHYIQYYSNLNQTLQKSYFCKRIFLFLLNNNLVEPE